MNRRVRPQRGFTLLEIIITILVAALAGLAVFAFVGGVVTDSGQPVHSARALAETRTPLEELTANYEEYRRGEIAWGDFVTALNDQGGVVEDISADLGIDTFEVYQIIIAGDHDQDLAAFFSE